MLSEVKVERLKTVLRGELIQPGDEGYDDARKVYNGMIDKHPRLIMCCADVADVIRSVNFAREHDVLLAIRGGGNFGVVTSFHFRGHPVTTVYAGPTLWSLDHACVRLEA